MREVSLNIGEIIAILDPLNPDAYDKLEKALGAKIIEAIGEEEWLKVWNSDDWTMNLTLNYAEAV